MRSKKMFKFLTKHLKERNVSYLSHLGFALEVGLVLSVASLVFVLHALLPFFSIPQKYNLESLALYLFEKNNILED
tara:strand:+ start:611 stop:838 length:228 start_codon:yes stop_codon:yes gene_type:complete